MGHGQQGIGSTNACTAPNELQIVRMHPFTHVAETPTDEQRAADDDLRADGFNGHDRTARIVRDVAAQMRTGKFDAVADVPIGGPGVGQWFCQARQQCVDFGIGTQGGGFS